MHIYVKGAINGCLLPTMSCAVYFPLLHAAILTALRCCTVGGPHRPRAHPHAGISHTTRAHSYSIVHCSSSTDCWLSNHPVH